MNSPMWALLNIKPGDRPFETKPFQFLWIIYLLLLTAFLMLAADSREGGVEGFSIVLLIGVPVLGYLYLISGVSDNLFHRLLKTLFSGIGFGLLFLLAIMFPQVVSQHGLRFEPPSPYYPFAFSTAVYAFSVIVVYTALRQPLSPPRNDDGSYPVELFEIHFANSWRKFQILISLTAALVIGMLLPLGALIIQLNDILVGSVGLFLSGTLLAYLPLTAQLFCEMYFLEMAVEYSELSEELDKDSQSP